MKTEVFDVIVLGLGAMGSSTLWQLAKQGRRVLGLDQFTPPHTKGSSHGHTRIIREAYFEDPVYVPFVQRAYDLWAELERQSGERLIHQTGGLMIGRPETLVFSGALRSAQEHGLAHEVLSAAEVTRRFPALKPSADMKAVLETRAGFLYPEKCVHAALNQARLAGAELLVETKVLAWKTDHRGVTVQTGGGTFTGKRLVISAGAWLPDLVPELAPKLRVERQVLYWFGPREQTDLFSPEKFPVYLWQYGPDQIFYGFPDVGEGIKVAGHHLGLTVHPDRVDRVVSPAEVDEMRDVVRRFLPLADGPLLNATVCMYTDTPDCHFLIDQHPTAENVWIASPCCGHGFKFASAVGELMATLALGGDSPFWVDLFKRKRLGA